MDKVVKHLSMWCSCRMMQLLGLYTSWRSREWSSHVLDWSWSSAGSGNEFCSARRHPDARIAKLFHECSKRNGSGGDQQCVLASAGACVSNYFASDALAGRTHHCWAFWPSLGTFGVAWWFAGAGGGPEANAWFVSAADTTIRMFGGSDPHCPIGRDLSRAATAWAKRSVANRHLHFIYESADEAFSFRSVRVALTMASGFGRESACWETSAAEPCPNLKSHLCGMNTIEAWQGVTYYLKSGLTAANIAGAPFGGNCTSWRRSSAWWFACWSWCPYSKLATSYTISWPTKYVAQTSSMSNLVEARQFLLTRMFGVPGNVVGSAGCPVSRFENAQNVSGSKWLSFFGMLVFIDLHIFF